MKEEPRMFGLLSRPAQKPVLSSRRAHLGVEQLESRDCPSGPSVSFMNFGVSVLNIGKQVELRGAISDPNPSSVQVNFSGVAMGSVYADANGYFDLKTTASGLGMVNVSAIDSNGSVASTAGQVSDTAPSIMLSISSYGPNRQVTLTGRVIDAQAGGLTVSFSGVVNDSVVTNADGTFSKTVTPTALGKVSATTQDVWGLTSATAQVNVADPTPTITLMGNNVSGNIWTFTGHVTGAYVDGETVTFSGTPAVNGQKVTVQADGSFSLTVLLSVGETGWVDATVTDWWGATATAAFCLPQHY
jgi:hypothetical protein